MLRQKAIAYVRNPCKEEAVALTKQSPLFAGGSTASQSAAYMAPLSFFFVSEPPR